MYCFLSTQLRRSCAVQRAGRHILQNDLIIIVIKKKNIRNVLLFSNRFHLSVHEYFVLVMHNVKVATCCRYYQQVLTFRKHFLNAENSFSHTPLSRSLAWIATHLPYLAICHVVHIHFGEKTINKYQKSRRSALYYLCWTCRHHIRERCPYFGGWRHNDCVINIFSILGQKSSS